MPCLHVEKTCDSSLSPMRFMEFHSWIRIPLFVLTQRHYMKFGSMAFDRGECMEDMVVHVEEGTYEDF